MKQHLTLHQLRKQLLVAESEINRAQLILEVEESKVELRRIAQQGMRLGAIVSSMAVAVAGLRAFQKGFGSTKESAAAPKTKASWLKKILSGARVASTVWSGFRAASHNEKQTV